MEEEVQEEGGSATPVPLPREIYTTLTARSDSALPCRQAPSVSATPGAALAGC